MNTTKLHILCLLSLVIVGGLIRAWPIADRPMWFDESDTWRSAVGDTKEGITYKRFLNWTAHFETPPLAFLLARLSADLFDAGQPVAGVGQEEALWRPSPWTLRLPALICGIALIPAVFVLGSLAHSATVGLWAAGLVAFDPSMVDQSQQCRMYAILALLMVVAMAWAVVLLREPRRSWWQWLGLGTVLGLLFWTLQFALVVWGGIVLAAGVVLTAGYLSGRLTDNPRRMITGGVVAYGWASLLACVGLYRVLARVGSGGGDGAGMSLSAIGREVIVAAKDLVHVPPISMGGVDLSVLGLGVYVLALIGLARLWSQNRVAVAVLVGVAVCNVLILFPFRRMHHFMDPRYLTGVQPAVWVGLASLAVGLVRQPGRVMVMAGLVVFIAIQAWQSTHLSVWYLQPDRYLNGLVIESVRDRVQPGEVVGYHPQVLEVLGNYYRLPTDAVVDAGLYEDYHLRAQPALPHDLDARAVWLIIGMMNHEGRVATAQKTIRAVAHHFGAPLDPSVLARHVAQERVVVVRLSLGKAVFRSVGVGESPDLDDPG